MIDAPELYKVISTSQWKNSEEHVSLSEMDREFIHFSKADQLDRIVNKFWRGENEYVILAIDPKLLPGDLVYETNPGGTSKYYHLYNGSIPKEAILHVEVIKRET